MRKDSSEMQTSHMDKEVLVMACGNAHGQDEYFCDRWDRPGSVLGWWRSIWCAIDDLIHQRQALSEV